MNEFQVMTYSLLLFIASRVLNLGNEKELEMYNEYVEYLKKVQRNFDKYTEQEVVE